MYTYIQGPSFISEGLRRVSRGSSEGLQPRGVSAATSPCSITIALAVITGSMQPTPDERRAAPRRGVSKRRRSLRTTPSTEYVSRLREGEGCHGGHCGGIVTLGSVSVFCSGGSRRREEGSSITAAVPSQPAARGAIGPHSWIILCWERALPGARVHLGSPRRDLRCCGWTRPHPVTDPRNLSALTDRYGRNANGSLSSWTGAPSSEPEVAALAASSPTRRRKVAPPTQTNLEGR